MEKHSKLWNTVSGIRADHRATLIIVGGTYVFKFPNNFSFGGVTGIAVVLGRVFFHLAQHLDLHHQHGPLVLGFAMLGKDFGVQNRVCQRPDVRRFKFNGKTLPHERTADPAASPGAGLRHLPTGLRFRCSVYIGASSGGTTFWP